METKLAQKPNDPFVLNNKAWLLATCPSEEFRDGALAVEIATEACELTAFNVAMILDTLAAGHAEAGDFESAVKVQTQVMQLEPSLDGGAERLLLYQRSEPYREGPPAMDYGTEAAAESPDAPADVSKSEAATSSEATEETP